VLSDGSSGSTYGQVNLALTVVPKDQGSGQAPVPQSGDGGDQFDQEITAGCNAGGSSGLGAMVLALGLVLRRRRR
jgi:uncharacterized protein (TIGR03382 family)